MDNEAFKAGDKDLRPNIWSYNNCLQSLAFSGEPLKAQKIVSKMYHRHKNGLLFEKPDILSWNLVLEAWVQSNRRDTPKQANNILKVIGELRSRGDLSGAPNFNTMRASFYCLIRSQTDGTREHILKTLDQMDEMVAGGGEAVAAYEYLSVIRELCKKGDDKLLARAELMIDRVAKGRQSFSAWNPRNVRASFKSLISAWRRSRGRHASEHVERLKLKRDSLEAELA